MRFAKLFLFTITVLCSCSNSKTTESTLSVFRYNESKGITSLDPAQARTQTNIWPVSQLFNGLVQLDNSLNVVPSIAKKWEIDEAGKEYRFYLRSDVLFHLSSLFENDSRIVRAEDFIYSFSRIRDPDVASPGSWIFDFLDDESPFEAINDTLLIIRLKDAFPPFLSMLAMPYCSVVPREIIEAEGNNFASAPIGTGPFRFKFWARDEMLVLLKNEAYFERDSAGISLPYFDALNISFIKDKQSEFLEFLKGNLDFLSGVHAAYKDELLTRSGNLNPKYSDRFQLLTIPYLNTEYLGILQEGEIIEGSPLKDVRIRKVLNYGFDRKKLMKYLRNNLGYAATGGMIPQGLPGFIGRGEGYEYNPDKALALLEDAGFPQGEGLPEIELTTTSDYLDICEYIQFELGKIGVQISINVNTGASFRNMVANGNLPFFRASWIADYADAENYLALFYSKNWTPDGPNYTKFGSDEYDSLYEAMLVLNNPNDRLPLYQKMDSLIMDAAPVIPLFYDMVVRFAPKGLEGFEPNPMNNLVLKNTRFSQED